MNLTPGSFSPIQGLERWASLHLASTGSTNADLKDLVQSYPDADGLWLSAGEQLQGRGRRGRVWSSPTGNLYASVLLNAFPADKLPLFPLACALAVYDAAFDALPDGEAAKLRLKWPNDLLHDGAKLCGILIEIQPLAGRQPALVAGFGINIAVHPEDTPYPAKHLRQCGFSGDAGTLFTALAENFARRIATLESPGGEASIRKAWISRATGIGDPITVRTPGGDLIGVFKALDENGLLVLHQPDGALKHISAGDVFFGLANGKE